MIRPHAGAVDEHDRASRGLPLAADVDEVQLEPVTRLERNDASVVTRVGVVRIGDDHGVKTRTRLADFQLGLGRSGRSGIDRRRSRPSSTARVTAADPKRSRTSSSAASRAMPL